MSIPSHPTAYLLILTGLFMIVGSLVQWTFLVILRRQHAKLWDFMGKPTIWTDQSLISAWPTIKFIQRKHYRGFDLSSVRFCDAFYLPLIFFYWTTSLLTLVFFVVIGIYGWPAQWR